MSGDAAAEVLLSPRQREIVVLVGRDGKAWQTVARELGISLSTVKTHVRAILERTGSTRRPRDAMAELYWRALGPSE